MLLSKKKENKEKKIKEPKVKHHKKHISILELVSLVAVLGISATIGVIVYKNHFRKQIPETDKELVNQLNQSISKHFGDTKEDLNLNDVLANIESDGIIFSKLSFKDPEVELVFDSNENSFGLLEGEKGVTYPVSIERSMKDIDPSLWRFINKPTGDLTNPYSYYLLDGCSGNITVIGGVDVGHNDDIASISYVNAIDKKQTVKIRTNSYETNLTVNEDVGDTINHYGRCGKLNVKRLHTDSFHEYGDTKYAYVTSGRVVAEKGGNIDVALVTSEVAFLQENGGTIKNAYASTVRVQSTALMADEKYGKKKALNYDQTIDQEDNVSKAESEGDIIISESIIEERIERGLEKHPNAIAYTKEGSDITVFDTFDEILEHFDEGREGIVNVINDITIPEKAIISDKNITFKGSENSRPTISGNIEVAHTSGGHTISFENIYFRSSDSRQSGIVDHSYSGSYVNELKFNNCEFSFSGFAPEDISLISLTPVSNYIGTKLTVNKCVFKTDNADISAISTRASYGILDSKSRGKTVYSYAQHVISGCTFIGSTSNKRNAIVTNYATLSENTFENYDITFDFVPTSTGSGHQFNVSVSSSTFRNERYLFNVCDLDDIYGYGDFNFNFERANSNIFENVKYIGHFDVNTTRSYIENNIESWSINQNWYGVRDTSIGVTLDEITMNLEVQTSLDSMTLPNGERITTYTQVENPLGEEESRTGYTVKDNEENLYYYYTTYNDEINIFFKEETNEPYACLLGDGEVDSLAVKELGNKLSNIDWFNPNLLADEDTYKELKYYDHSSSEKVGALIRLNFDFTTVNGNTFIDLDVANEENHLSVAVKEGKSLGKVYYSSVGNASKLLVTSNVETASPDNETALLTIPSEDVELTLSGDYSTNVEGSISTLFLKNRMNIKLLEDLSIEETKVSKVSIDGEKSKNLQFINNVIIEEFIINAQANIINFGSIDKVICGKSTLADAETILNETKGACINNKNIINDFTSYAQVTLNNLTGAKINNIVITSLDGYEALAQGSSIYNEGYMCVGDGNIHLEVKCSLFTSISSEIGDSNRTTSGGVIYIGSEGKNNFHDGITITIGGLLKPGLDSELNKAKFVVYGAPQGSTAPEIYITNQDFTVNESEEYIKVVSLNPGEVAPIIHQITK